MCIFTTNQRYKSKKLKENKAILFDFNCNKCGLNKESF